MTRQETTTGMPRIPLTTGWGVGLAALTAVISGFSVFINSYAVKELPDAAVYTTLKNGVAAAILLVVALAVVPRAEVRSIDRRSWGVMGLIGVIGGSIPFLLFFTGLAMASAPTAAFIHKTLFLWVLVLAVPFLGERLGWFPIAAVGVLLAGQVLVAPPTGVTWGQGETMILGATLLWAVEVILARKLLIGAVPSPVLGAARMSIGLIILVGYLVVTGRLPVVAGLTATQWSWALSTGILLSAYVATWMAALRRAPASVVASVLVLGAPMTAILAGVVNGKTPELPAVIGQVLIATAVGLVALLAIRRPGGTQGHARDGVPDDRVGDSLEPVAGRSDDRGGLCRPDPQRAHPACPGARPVRTLCLWAELTWLTAGRTPPTSCWARHRAAGMCDVSASWPRVSRVRGRTWSSSRGPTASRVADGRVVEAYWLGNELLDQVPMGMFGDSLDARSGRAFDQSRGAGSPARRPPALVRSTRSTCSTSSRASA